RNILVIIDVRQCQVISWANPAMLFLYFYERKIIITGSCYFMRSQLWMPLAVACGYTAVT
ncbi:hypothetical protein, partial [Pluralibacter gergoviae]|uniref:hypothetical protein n=1 Tax=Pluralibacter gergoviae TaxID=61647 RepID=UPI001E42462E